MYNIGFIGLGRMGQAICLRLLSHDIILRVYNRTPEKATKLLDKGAVWCNSPAELGAACDIIMLCLSGEQVTEALLTDSENGLLRHCHPGCMIIDTGTISPESATYNAHLTETQGQEYISCPVSGGVEGANNGTLAAIVAAQPAVRTIIESVISRFADRITWLTSHADAQKLKIINNLAESINLLGAFEVLNIGLTHGITLDELHSVLTTCRGRSAYMDVALRFLNSNLKPSDVSLAVRCKDLCLAGSLADISRHYPISDAAIELFSRVREKYGDEQDQCEYFNFINEEKKLNDN
ncbi:NAD(P)-dependent oxidoreductase [Xenorhabdus bovienii]|uniref:Putative 6-phosphogluconate dehydrogenase NAD-binding protein n=1 Tax=Xenorhabdus bovienii TaxID=40576 RepID=A0A0B6XAU3_XENBV|nr:NAD(P)-dependent oxidoreductase [Xenorhabdus bovienii]MCG3462613.1 NAD(P)-dependent oxidoreductase [Xenorhabdus bovienii]CDM89404.1 putative 6-phosphogluconate dehydrogenase NAD-binding protein [Xenorhabdus bovienii]